MSRYYPIICRDLGLSNVELISIMETQRKYRTFNINKRTGGTRMIFSPSPEVKVIQLWLANKIFKQFDTSQNAFAYRKGCSIKQNVKAHQKNRYNFRFDLKNFFPTIQFHHFMVFLEANKALLPGAVQDDFDDFLDVVRKFCFLEGGDLPQGFCSSPIISNILMAKCDREIELGLQKISEDIVYTRYADDLTISFNKKERRGEVRAFIHGYFGSPDNIFSLNPSKERFGSSKAGSMFVNGIKICHDKHITIHRSYKDKIRRLFFAYSKGFLNESGKRSLLGHLYYLRSVDPVHFNKINRKYFFEIKEIKKDMS